MFKNFLPQIAVRIRERNLLPQTVFIPNFHKKHILSNKKMPRKNTKHHKLNICFDLPFNTAKGSAPTPAFGCLFPSPIIPLGCNYVELQ